MTVHPYQQHPPQHPQVGVVAPRAGFVKRRSPVGVWLGLPLITLGIYHLVWYYKIHAEMAELRHRAPERNLVLVGFDDVPNGSYEGESQCVADPALFLSALLERLGSYRRPPDAAKMWGERIQNAREKGMDSLVESTLGRWFTEPFRTSRKDVMARIGNDIRATPVAGFVGCCHAISRVDYLDRLKEIKCPVLVMVGEHDHGTPPDAARAIHQNLKGSELKIIPSAAHLSNIEQAQVFNDAMMGFLNRVAR